MKLNSFNSLVCGVGMFAISLANTQAATVTLAEQGTVGSPTVFANINVAQGTNVNLDLLLLGFAPDAGGGSFDIYYNPNSVSGITFTFNAASGLFSFNSGADDGVGKVAGVNLAAPLGVNFPANTVGGTLSFMANTAGVSTIYFMENPFDPFLDANGNNSPTTFLGANITISAVPIPPAIWLLGSALIGLVGLSRRKQEVK